MVKRILRAVNPQHFLILLITIFAMNLADGLLTLLWITDGIAYEANPFMAAWLDLGPGYFIIVKVVLVTALLGLLHQFYDRLLTRLLVILVMIAYTFVMGIHLHIILAITRSL